jgi:hypothetical protein
MTNSHNLNVQRLQAVVDAFGANPERWPAAEQSALEVLATGDKAARDIVGEARKLDFMLDQAEPPPAAPELMADILFVPPKANWRQVLAELWPFGPIWKPASGLAMALAISVMTAALMPLPEAEADVMAEIEREIETELLDLEILQ